MSINARRLIPVGLAATMAAIGIAASPASASTSVTTTSRCASSVGTCSVRFVHSRSGTVTVRVTKQARTHRKYGWKLTASGRTVCFGTVTAGAGTSVKSCPAVPRGLVTFSVSAAGGPTLVSITR